MSGELHPPPPLFTSAQAAILLDQVVYEQVLECVDVDALVQLEHMLAVQIGELDGVERDRARELARSMLDRAVVGLPDDIRRYLRAAAFLSCDGCVLCEEEARQAGRATSGGSPRHSGRLRS